ncbi:A disintegrin and metalloproteinase with thrombospondin motifs 20-like isoform X2 [Sciurus carolinensis]|uniref:A disintegrin and metalloproteinase with thrombospondin motifs 20-like isoform X2 n=1 Tax=Sciurus carolinensis TaxID=30640 RepID=UPI001FB1A7D6|nr:A disintegrin and metalloproteinase with thrombospondin motifs 20-like isoform X2 [Sciurus carolinensis]XP_047393483.1 A disintegrin and metalloproteinase with thrombospondin motifs 20-like isoform X2 [Sciurus carolinensis]
MSGYSVVVKIPTGATNIEILQHSYSGKPEDDNHLGKHFWWLCMGNLYNPDVRYSFHVPVEDTSDLFTWEHMDHDKTVPKCVKCLVTYGKGSKQQQVCCQLNEDHLSDGFCNPSTKPESLRPCELHARAAWKVGSWRSCTATCYLGYQICAVKCVNKLVSAVLDDRECQGAIAQVIGRTVWLLPAHISLILVLLPYQLFPWEKQHSGDMVLGPHAPCLVEELIKSAPPCGEWQAGNWSPIHPVESAVRVCFCVLSWPVFSQPCWRSSV